MTSFSFSFFRSFVIAVRGVVLVSTSLLIVGCATGSGGGSDPQLFDHIISHRTGFLQKGPEQATPPDKYLDEGTRIHLLQHYDTYVQVEMVNGETGWVQGTDVADAPAE